VRKLKKTEGKKRIQTEWEERKLMGILKERAYERHLERIWTERNIEGRLSSNLGLQEIFDFDGQFLVQLKSHLKSSRSLAAPARPYAIDVVRALRKRGKMISVSQARTLSELLRDPMPCSAEHSHRVPPGEGSPNGRPLGVWALQACVYLGNSASKPPQFTADYADGDRRVHDHLSEEGKARHRWVSDGMDGKAWDEV
jgi:hypothetical protein